MVDKYKNMKIIQIEFKNVICLPAVIGIVAVAVGFVAVFCVDVDAETIINR